MTYSFDIFDTCLVRKCGTPENMLDVLSLRVFKEPVEEWVRQEFVVARRVAEGKVWNENPFSKLTDIYAAMQFEHKALYSLPELEEIEIALEKELLVPVLKMRERIDALRAKGHHIIYISDMYLPEVVIREKMEEYGFLQEGDTLYISCEVGKQKQDGSLFRYVQEKEGLNVRQWKHIGDNKHNNYLVPKSLGIKAEQIEWDYNPYPAQWRKNDYSLGFKYPSVMAGLSRALSLSMPDNTHKLMLTDIISPFFVTFVYRILEDAYRNGIDTLYFCARDAHTIYLIAQKYADLFPGLRVEYMYISQKSLYKGDAQARIMYFEQIGLARKSNTAAIVDLRTSGKTLYELNNQLEQNGYQPVKGYFFEMFYLNEIKYRLHDYRCEVNHPYIRLNDNNQRLVSFWHLYEMFFSIHVSERTVDYQIVNGKAEPVFDVNHKSDQEEHQDSQMVNKAYWADYHRELILRFAEEFKNLKLYRYSNCLFEHYIIPTMARFFDIPRKVYLPALMEFSIYNEARDEYLPFIKKCSLLELLKYRGRNTSWKRGTLVYNLPPFITSIYKWKKWGIIEKE